MKAFRTGPRPAARGHCVLWVLAAVALLVGRPAAARADSPPEISPEERLKIEEAIPAKAPAVPKKPRKLLVFTLNVGYAGHRSIPYASLAFTLMGQQDRRLPDGRQPRSGNLPAARALRQFDAVFLNNTVGNLFTDAELRRSLVEFVYGGGGLLGVHGTAVAFTRWEHGGQEDWPEFALMLGARAPTTASAPSTCSSSSTIPIIPSIGPSAGKGFDFRDEFFRFQEVYSRDRVRVLLSIDTAEDGHAPGPILRQGRAARQRLRPGLGAEPRQGAGLLLDDRPQSVRLLGQADAGVLSGRHPVRAGRPGGPHRAEQCGQCGPARQGSDPSRRGADRRSPKLGRPSVDGVARSETGHNSSSPQSVCRPLKRKNLGRTAHGVWAATLAWESPHVKSPSQRGRRSPSESQTAQSAAAACLPTIK